MKHLSLNSDLGIPETVLVLGVGRGGTSLVAGTLRCLGISMGSDPHPVKHEWSPVVYASEGIVDISASLENIEQMNQAHEMWGWKYPADVFALDTILPLVRSPGIIVVTRDLVDLTLSAERYGETPWEIGFLENADVYSHIGTQLRFWPYPVLVVSFHEILAKPDEFVELLCSFLQISPTREQKQDAFAFNSPERNAYRSVGATTRTLIAPGDLQKDVDALAALHIRRYTQDYVGRFAGMKTDTATALSMLAQHLTAAPEDERVKAIATRFVPKFSKFSSDLSPAAASVETCAPGLPRDGMAPIEVFRHILDASERAFESISRSLHDGDYTTAVGYLLLRKLRRMLLLLISLRTELQKCLQLFAPASG